MPKPADVTEEFRTAETGAAVFCHQDFLQKVEENRRTPVGKRASLLLERLAVDPRREFYKSTLGVNKGWRRSRLGGHGGNHYYAWWAPKGAPPLRASPEFENAPDGAVFLRDIRHHDDHSELRPQSFADNYLPLSVRDLRSEDYLPSPLTPVQAQFTASRQKVRVIKGYPGSGKTTALWYAADANSARSALYLTYSKDLAALAQTYFQRFAPAHKEFRVLTFGRLMRELSGVETPPVPERESRERFLRELASLPPRVLGPWADDRKALYDEIHANLVGAALPVAMGRFAACERPRVPDRVYRELRRRFIGGAAADAVLEVVNTLLRRQPDFHELFFPELLLAWKAAERLRSPTLEKAASKMLSFDCIAVDEAQDLTPIEALVITALASAIRDRTQGALSLLIAGDEAQTVRATDFDWGWFHDMLHHQVGSPQEFKLAVNLRSPRRIAHLVNAVWGLYSTVAKQDRPGGAREAEIEDEASDHLVYCAAARGPELEQLLRAFADREGLAVIYLAGHLPDYIPADLKPRVLSVNEAKGLDFQSVCILDPGSQLHRILKEDERARRDFDVEPLSRRLAIDQFRVAVSRPTERIYFLDVAPGASHTNQLLSFLQWADEDHEVAPVIPAALLKSLEEELLEPEVRVRRCEIDARQFLEVKPEMAWARARQAVSLLGRPGEKQAITDEPVRQSAYMTLAQVAFTLAVRRIRLGPELGHPDFWTEAGEAAHGAGRGGLAMIIHSIADWYLHPSRPGILASMELIAEDAEPADPWLSLELSSQAPGFLSAVESGATDLVQAPQFLRVLPAAYRLYGVTDAAERIAKLRRQAIGVLMEGGNFPAALELIEQEPDAPPEWKARCFEGLGSHIEAAEIFRAAGMPKDALRNYRAIPDFDKALELMRELGDEAGAEPLRWLMELRQVLEKRPANFAGAATPAEKQYLAALLEAQMEGPHVPRPPRAKTKTRKTASNTAPRRR